MTTSSPVRVESHPLGASRLPGGDWAFVLWAPLQDHVSVHLLGPRERLIELEKDERGYHFAVVDEVDSDARYFYRLNRARELPDPASRFQPEGPHGPSQVIDPTAFRWTDAAWKGRPLEGQVIYEMHIGALTIRNMRLAFADLHTFDRYGLSDKPAMLLGMDVLSLCDRVTVDFDRREAPFTLR